MNNTLKLKDWNDITLEKFYKIKDIMEVEDEYQFLNLLDLIYDIDSSNLPLTEFGKYREALQFLGSEVPTVNLKDKYELNGTVYNSSFNLTTVSTGQFVDYQNYIKNNKWEDFLSVFFIPEGHTYNDGYSINKVKEDVLSLDFPTVKSITFFFTIQLEAFVGHFLSSLKKTVKKMKLTKDQKKELLDKIEQADLTSLDLFLSY